MSLKRKEKKASSGAAVARLGGSGFVSFSDVVAAETPPPAAGPARLASSTSGSRMTPVYTGDHPDLSVACKKLLKKDTTTKLRALQEVLSALRAPPSADPAAPSTTTGSDAKLLADFLGFFTFAFTKMVSDDSWQVRERLGQVLLAVIERDKQSLGPFMKESIGPWWQLAADPVKEVHEKFREAFALAIPAKRRPLVLLHLSSSVLKHIVRNLTMEPAELKEMTQCADEDLDEKYERMVRSTVDCAARLLQSLSAEQNEQVLRGVTSSSDLIAGEDSVSYEHFFTSGAVFKHCKSPHASVRRATYQLLAEFAERLPAALENHLEACVVSLLSAFDEKFDNNVAEGLHALVVLANVFPAVWSKNQHVNMLLQKLRALRKSKAALFSQYLLPLLASVPASKLGMYAEEGGDAGAAGKGQKVLESFVALLAELASPAAEDDKALADVKLASAALDCLTFIVLRKLPEQIASQMKIQTPRLEALLQPVLSVLRAFFRSLLLQEESDSLRGAVQSTLLAFHKNSVAENHVSAGEWRALLWAPLERETRALLSDHFESLIAAKKTPTLAVRHGLLRFLADLCAQTDLDAFSADTDAGGAGIASLLEGAARTVMSAVEVPSGAPFATLYCTIPALHELLSTSPTRYFSSIVRELFSRPAQWLSLLAMGLGEQSEDEESAALAHSAGLIFAALVRTLSSSSCLSNELCAALNAVKAVAFSCCSPEAIFLLLSESEGESVVLLESEVHALRGLCALLLPYTQTQSAPSADVKQKLDAVRYKGALAKRSSVFHLALLLSFCRCGAAGLDAVVHSLVTEALHCWRGAAPSNVLCVSFLLHLGHALREDVRMRGRVCFQEFITTRNEEVEMLWESDESCALTEKLSALFFAAQNDESKSSCAIATMDTVPSLFDLPSSLPRSPLLWHTLAALTLQALSAEKCAQVVSTLSAKVDELMLESTERPQGEGEQGAENADVWAKHAVRLLELRETHTRAASSPLRILSASFWRGKATENETTVVTNHHILACFFSLQQEISRSESVSHDVLFADLSLWIAITLALISNLKDIKPEIDENIVFFSRSIIEMQRTLFLGLSQSEQRRIVLELLQGVTTESFRAQFTTTELASVDDLVLWIVRNALDITPVAPTPNSVILKHPFPGRSTVKGHDCAYITSTPIDTAEDSSSSPSLVSMQCQDAQFIGCHLEDGPFHPYYSISLAHPVAKELQTEWHRLLMRGVRGSDLVRVVSSPNCNRSSSSSSDSYAAELRAIDEESGSLSTGLLLWLQREVERVWEEISPQSESLAALERNVSWAQVQTSLAYIVDLFPLLAATSPVRSLVLEAVVCAPLRGLALLLVGERFSHSVRALQTAALLLRALLSCSVGVGSGLWLSTLLHSLYSSPLLQLNSEQLARKAVDWNALLSALLSVCAELIDCDALESNFLHWLLEHKVLVVTLSPSFDILARLQRADAPGGESNDELRVSRLIKGLWRAQAARRSSTEQLESNTAVRSWESTFFDFSVREFLRTQRAWVTQRNVPIAFKRCEALRSWETIQSLHYCLLSRTREASSQIVRSSSILAENYEHLLEMSVTLLQEETAVEESEEFEDTLRLQAAKLLDVLIVSGALWEHSPFPAHPEDDETEDSDEKESSRDAEMLRYVLGDAVHARLEDRFDLRRIQARAQHAVSAQLSTALAETSLDAEADFDADALSDDLLEQVNDLATMHAYDTKLTGRFNQLGKRAVYRSLVQHDGLGTVLVWLLALQAIDAVSVRHWDARARCGATLKSSGLFQRAMDFLLLLAGDLLHYKDITATLQHLLSVNCSSAEKMQSPERCWAVLPPVELQQIQGSLPQLACYALFRTISTLPALFRGYWSDDCRRVDKLKLSRFVEERVRQSIIAREIAQIRIAKASNRWNESEFEVKGNATTGEIVASFLRDETKIVITIKMPAVYPLKNVEVDCTSRIGVSDGRWRRWLLQMIQLLSMQDGSVVDAALLWKSNIEKEMEGVEPCPICYCTIHTKTLKLPTLACPTCKHKFHPVCLHTWFKTSGKSKCVLCQQPMHF